MPRHKSKFNFLNLFKSRGAKVLVFGLIVGVAFLTFGAAVQSGAITLSTINITPVKFNPIHVKAWGYDVYNDKGDWLGEVNASTTVGHFIDKNHQYPRVDCGYSEPYLSDAYGEPIVAGEDTHDPIARFVVNGKVLFYHEYYYSTQFWARTYYNAPVLTGSADTYLNPLHGHPYSRGGGTGGSGILTVTGSPNSWNNLPQGCLAGILDTGISPWGGNYASGAAITCGIVPIDYLCGGSPIRPKYSFDEQIANLTTNYGNRKVIVRPWIDLAALSQYIKYTYTTVGTLPNGTQATITATETSGKVGFMWAGRTDNDQMKGVVPNYFPNNEVARIPADEPTAGKSNIPQGSTTQPTPKVEASGSITYKYPGLDRGVGGGAQPFNIWCPTLVGEIPSLELTDTSLDGFALPQEIELQPGYELQPYTKIGISMFEVDYSFYHWDGSGWDNYATPWSSSNNLEVPTSITSQNVYASSVATYKIGLISENELQVVTSTGKKIDPKLFTDFELTSFVGDPRSNDYHTEVSQTNENLFDAFMANLQTIVIWIVVIFGIGLVFFLIIKAKMRPSGTSSGLPERRGRFGG